MDNFKKEITTLAGTREGGLKAAQTCKRMYGLDFYGTIGRAGGVKSRGGGFTNNSQAARIAGRKGGKAPRRDSGRVT